MLQFFHTGSRTTAAPPALARLRDAVLLLECGVADHVRPAASATAPLRHALEHHLDQSTGAPTSDGAAPPPPPCREALRRAGVPLVPGPRFVAAVEAVAARRARSREYVVRSQWDWVDA